MSNILSTDWMQGTGKHYMGNGLSHEVAEVDLAAANKLVAEKDQKEITEALNKSLDKVKDFHDKTIKPCNATVIVKPYDENPYRPIVSKAGLIIGGYEGTFKNPDSGEQDTLDRGIWCCKVIAVGPKCENVKEGDDVYVNFRVVVPLPFGDYGYYSISETNIICSIK